MSLNVMLRQMSRKVRPFTEVMSVCDFRCINVQFLDDLRLRVQNKIEARSVVLYTVLQEENFKSENGYWCLPVGSTVEGRGKVFDGMTKVKVDSGKVVPMSLKKLKFKVRSDWSIEEVYYYVLRPRLSASYASPKPGIVAIADECPIAVSDKEYKGQCVIVSGHVSFSRLVLSLVEDCKNRKVDTRGQFVWLETFGICVPMYCTMMTMYRSKQKDQLLETIVTRTFPQSMDLFKGTLLYLESISDLQPLNETQLLYFFHCAIARKQKLRMLTHKRIILDLCENFEEFKQQLSCMDMQTSISPSLVLRDKISKAIHETGTFATVNDGLIDKLLDMAAQPLYTALKRNTRSPASIVKDTGVSRQLYVAGKLMLNQGCKGALETLRQGLSKARVAQQPEEELLLGYFQAIALCQQINNKPGRALGQINHALTLIRHADMNGSLVKQHLPMICHYRAILLKETNAVCLQAYAESVHYYELHEDAYNVMDVVQAKTEYARELHTCGRYSESLQQLRNALGMMDSDEDDYAGYILYNMAKHHLVLQEMEKYKECETRSRTILLEMDVEKTIHRKPHLTDDYLAIERTRTILHLRDSYEKVAPELEKRRKSTALETLQFISQTII